MKKYSKLNTSHKKAQIRDCTYIRKLEYRQIHWLQSRIQFSEYGKRENGEFKHLSMGRVSVGDDEKVLEIVMMIIKHYGCV